MRRIFFSICNRVAIYACPLAMRYLDRLAEYTHGCYLQMALETGSRLHASEQGRIPSCLTSDGGTQEKKFGEKIQYARKLQ